LPTWRTSAYLDDLTRLYNARYLDEALDRELHGKGPFSLLFLDLDHFKSVNDTHGTWWGASCWSRRRGW
jgi:diguanylate cyclase (GGDEF)-like protein